MRTGMNSDAVRQVLVSGMLAMVVGCTTNREYLRLDIPAGDVPVQVTDKHVVIRSVVDKRVFEDNPGDPSTPSLGFGGIQNVSGNERKRAIARKRSKFGKAAGDIFLDEGQTVELLIADLLKSSLREMGYVVVDQNPATSDSLVMDVTIDKFWAWFKPGGAFLFQTEIATTIHVSRVSGGANQTKQVAAATSYVEPFGAGTWAWKTIFRKGLQNYKEGVKTHLPRPLESRAFENRKEIGNTAPQDVK